MAFGLRVKTRRARFIEILPICYGMRVYLNDAWRRKSAAAPASEDLVEVVPVVRQAAQTLLAAHSWRNRTIHQAALVDDTAHAGDEANLVVESLDPCHVKQADPLGAARRPTLCHRGGAIGECGLTQGESQAEEWIARALGATENRGRGQEEQQEARTEENAASAADEASGSR